MTSVPAAVIIYQIVCDLKATFAATPVWPGLPFVKVYPDDPEALPKNYMEDAPSKWQPPSLCTLLQSDTIPLRKTHKAISQQNKLATPSINCQPTSSSVQPQDLCQVMMQGMQGMMNMFGQMAGNFAGNDQHQATRLALPAESTTNTPAVEVLKPKDEPKQHLALEAPPPPPLKNDDITEVKSDESTTQAAGLPVASAEEIENAAFDALKSKTAASKGMPKAKGKAKAKAKAKAQTSKNTGCHNSPAGASAKGKGKQGMKRPAACLKKPFYCPKYLVPTPGPEWQFRTKDSWTSKHYHAARALAQHAGADNETAKDLARQAHKEASEIWMHHSWWRSSLYGTLIS